MEGVRVLVIQTDPEPEDIVKIDEIFKRFGAEKISYRLIRRPLAEGEEEEVGDELAS